MSTVINILSTGTIGFVCAKTLKAIGKKDCSEIVAACTWMAVGVLLVGGVVSGWTWFCNTEAVQTIGYIFDKIGAFIEWLA